MPVCVCVGEIRREKQKQAHQPLPGTVLLRMAMLSPACESASFWFGPPDFSPLSSRRGLQAALKCL